MWTSGILCVGIGIILGLSSVVGRRLSRSKDDWMHKPKIVRLEVSLFLEKAEATFLFPEGSIVEESIVRSLITEVMMVIVTERMSLGMTPFPPKDNPVMIEVTFRVWNPELETFLHYKNLPYAFGSIVGD